MYYAYVIYAREVVYLKESYIEKKFIKKIKAEGGFALKFISPSMTGVPDRIVLMPNGKAIFVLMFSLFS